MKYSHALMKFPHGFIDFQIFLDLDNCYSYSLIFSPARLPLENIQKCSELAE